MLFVLAPDQTFNLVLLVITGVATLFICFLILAVVFWLARRRDRKDGLAWAAAAGQLGLQLSPPTGQMQSDLDRWRNATVDETQGPLAVQPMIGTFAGRAVDVRLGATRRRRYHASRHGRIRRRLFFTLCQTSWRGPSGVEFRITKKSSSFNLTDALGITESNAIETGIAPFDEKFTVQGNDPRRIGTLLGRPLSDGQTCATHFVRAAQAGWNVTASQSGVTIRFEGKVLQAEQLAAGLTMATGLAGLLESAGTGL